MACTALLEEITTNHLNLYTCFLLYKFWLWNIQCFHANYIWLDSGFDTWAEKHHHLKVTNDVRQTELWQSTIFFAIFRPSWMVCANNTSVMLLQLQGGHPQESNLFLLKMSTLPRHGVCCSLFLVVDESSPHRDETKYQKNVPITILIRSDAGREGSTKLRGILFNLYSYPTFASQWHTYPRPEALVRIGWGVWPCRKFALQGLGCMQGMN